MNQKSSTLFTMPLDNKINKYNYTDEKLMSLFQGGDENAYIVLVNRYKDKLINFIYHYLKDSESAEDVVQETMIKLYQKKTLLQRNSKIFDLAVHNCKKFSKY